MASSYSSLLRIELMGNGDQSNTWGTTLNAKLGTVLEQAIAGRASVPVTDGADTTLTTANGATDQARCMALNLTGALTAARNVICPTSSKLYVVQNNTTGGYAVTVKTSGGAGSAVAQGQRLAEERCAACHAVGRTGASPRPPAPAFRDLHRRYPVDQLAEAAFSAGQKANQVFESRLEEARSLIARSAQMVEEAGDATARRLPPGATAR
jgi:mono/diheme cytochrome c family protein